MTEAQSEHIWQARQQYGKTCAQKKLPLWYANDKILYPQRISLEQCSSEESGRFKASLVKGDSFADLCGGFGVDTYFISQNFGSGYYVESNRELSEIAEANFKALGADNITCVTADSESFLHDLKFCNLIYLDPARRNSEGKKLVILSDCSPNVLQLKDELLSKCDTLMIKLSPLFDIKAAIKSIPETYEAWVVAVRNECKELLLLAKADNNRETTIKCINLPSKDVFGFTMSEEEGSEVEYSLPLAYLYEPSAAILKAGAFKCFAAKTGLKKLQQNSHLYTSNELLPNFMGRVFRVCAYHGAGAKYLSDVKNANLSVRNFPCSAAELKKKLKIKDGGDLYLFASTLHDGRHVIIRCTKI